MGLAVGQEHKGIHRLLLKAPLICMFWGCKTSLQQSWSMPPCLRGLCAWEVAPRCQRADEMSEQDVRKGSALKLSGPGSRDPSPLAEVQVEIAVGNQMGAGPWAVWPTVKGAHR